MSVVQLSAARAGNGRFVAGVSGNPAGRQKGSRNRSTLLMASLGEDDAEAVVAAAVAKAKSGDGPMLRCLVTRILPAVRSRPVELAVPDGRETDIRALHDATLKGLAQGDILPDEALMIARALEKMARALATAAAAATPQPRRRGKPRSPSPLVGEGRGGGRPAAVRAGERPSDAHPHPALSHRGGGCGEAAPANRLFPPAAADGDGPEKEIVGIRELEGSGGSDARRAPSSPTSPAIPKISLLRCGPPVTHAPADRLYPAQREARIATFPPPRRGQ